MQREEVSLADIQIHYEVMVSKTEYFHKRNKQTFSVIQQIKTKKKKD